MNAFTPEIIYRHNRGFSLMKISQMNKKIIATTVLVAAANVSSINSYANDKGEFYADFRLRFESVSQDNALEDADALTLRTKVGYKTASVNGFSGLIEAENSLALIDDYTLTPIGLNVGKFSIIPDPDSHTEIDQALLKYKASGVTAKLGRQAITLDNHRFVGDVAWRQDKQTFDALSLRYAPNKTTTLKYAYLDKRNRIFADEGDVDSKDHLLNASFKLGGGKLTSYAYLLEMDNGSSNSLDTFGVSYAGKSAGLSYRAEFATQDLNDKYDTDYLGLELTKKFDVVTGKVGYEKLGSDKGAYGFSTPLAPLHKFNGWADQFLGTPKQGLEDVYFLVKGKVAGGKLVAAYHDYSSEIALAGANDLGSEINLLYTKKFSKRYSGGIKYADYSAGNAAFGKVDADKVWVWMGAKF